MARDLYCLIGALVVDQDFDVCHFGKLADSLLERLRRIVGGHDGRDALPVNHSALLCTLDDPILPSQKLLSRGANLSEKMNACSQHPLVLPA